MEARAFETCIPNRQKPEGREFFRHTRRCSNAILTDWEPNAVWREKTIRTASSGYEDRFLLFDRPGSASRPGKIPNQRREITPGGPAPGARYQAAGTSTRYSIAQENRFVYKNFSNFADASPSMRIPRRSGPAGPPPRCPCKIHERTIPNFALRLTVTGKYAIIIF